MDHSGFSFLQAFNKRTVTQIERLIHNPIINILKHLNRIKRDALLGQSWKLSNQLFKVRSTCVIACPVMRLMVAVVREEVATVLRPFHIDFLLPLLYRLHIIIHCAKKESELRRLLLVSEYFSNIFKEVKVDFSKLVSEVHSSSDHYMVGFIVWSILFQTFECSLWIIFNIVKLSEELWENSSIWLLARPLAHSTRSIIQFMHYMSKDIVIALIRSIKSL